MAETETQGGASGEPEGGAEPTPAAPSGESGAVTPPADAFATERAQLEAQRAEWQGRYDRLKAEMDRSAPAPTPTTPTEPAAPVDFRAELRRFRQLDAAVGGLREQFPLATDVFDDVDSYDSVEQLAVAAENTHKRMEALFGSHVESAVSEAIKPYVEKFGPLQTAPAGAQPGQGEGLPTLEEINRMSLSELDALEQAHPGHAARLHREALTRP